MESNKAYYFARCVGELTITGPQVRAYQVLMPWHCMGRSGKADVRSAVRYVYNVIIKDDILYKLLATIKAVKSLRTMIDNVIERSRES